MSNQNVLSILAESEAAAIHRERARLGVENAKQGVETARAALETARAAVEAAKGRENEAKSAEEEILARADVAGIARKALKQATEDRMVALLGSGLLQLTALDSDEPDKSAIVENIRAPRAPRVSRKVIETVAPVETAAVTAVVSAAEEVIGDGIGSDEIGELASTKVVEEQIVSAELHDDALATLEEVITENGETTDASSPTLIDTVVDTGEAEAASIPVADRASDTAADETATVHEVEAEAAEVVTAPIATTTTRAAPPSFLRNGFRSVPGMAPAGSKTP